MADDIVRTVIEAVDNATPVINQVGTSYEKLGTSIDNVSKEAQSAADRTVQSFTSMAQALNSGTNTAAAQSSIGALNEMLSRGDISAETYGAAMLRVGEDSGLMSAKSIEAAGKITELNQQLATGEINAEQYAEGVKKVQTELSAAAPATTTLTTESNSLMGTLVGLGAAALAAKVSLKAAFDFSVEGAQINRIQEQFTNTMQSMGIEAEGLMTRMQAAVRGTVDDEALAQASTRAFTQGIVTNGDQMVRLLELARAKSVLLGQDTQSVFESIIQSADMLSTRGFKRLGINLESITKLTEDYAKAHGVSAASIDTETQKTILLNAALDKSKDAIDKANMASDDQLTKIQRLETGWAEFGDTLKSGAADVLVTFIDDMGIWGHLADANIPILKRLADAQKLNDNSLSGWYHQLTPFIDAMQKYLEKVKDAESGAYGIGGALDESARATQRAAEATQYLTSLTPQLDAGMRDNTLSALAATNAAGGLAAAYAAAAKEFSAASSILNAEISGAVGNEIDSYTKKNSDLHDKLAKVRDELQKLQAAQGSPIQNRNIMSTVELTAAQAKLAVITEDLTNKTRRANETDAEFSSRMAELQVQHDNLAGKIQNGSQAVLGYVNNSKKIGELKSTYDDLTKQIDDAANAHDIATKKILFNIASQQAAAIVAQDPSKAAIFASALNEVALKYGIIDQATKTATDNIIAANAQLAKDGNLDSYLGKLGMQAQLSSRTAEQATADAQTVINAHAAQVAAMGTPIVAKVDTKPLTEFQQHLQDKKPFDDYKAKVTDVVTKSATSSTLIKTDITGIMTQQQLMANDPSIPAYGTNVGAMAATAHGYYSDIRNDIDQTIARQQALNQALANGTAAGYTGNAPAPAAPIKKREKVLGGGAAGGTDFLVPPGYPNDSYPLNVQSGERVIVQTPAQQAAAPQPQGGGVSKPPTVNNVTINDPLSSAIWLTYIYGQNRIAADARM